MEYINRPSILLIIVSLQLLVLPLSLYSVEGNEPKPNLKLIPPEIKSKDTDTTKIPMPEIFGLFFNSKYGYTDYGKEYQIGLQKEGVNHSFGMEAGEIDKKTKASANLGLRTIGDKSMLTAETKANVYKIDKYYDNCTANFGGTFFGGKNILKTEASIMYENELLWDAMMMLGRNPTNNIFAGIGISVPYIAPAIQVNWNVNNKMAINALYRNKQVTSTFDEMYMTNPYIEVNPDLKHETYSIAGLKLLFGESFAISGTYKYITNAIDFVHPTYPENIGSANKWESELSFKTNRLQNNTSIEYRPSAKYYLPELKIKNILAFLFPYGIELKMENQYIGERDANLPGYFLHGITMTKRFKNLEIWIKGSNLTNTKYEVIKNINGYETSAQAGIRFRI